MIIFRTEAYMVTKTKTSVSLSSSLLNELVLLNRDRSVSEFIEKACIHYMNELKRQERGPLPLF